MRKRYRERLAEIRDVLSHLGQQRAAFKAYIDDEKQKLADGSIRREVVDDVLREERARLHGAVEGEKFKLRARERRINETAKEEVYEKALGKERAALERGREKLADERREVEDARKAIPLLQTTEAHILELAQLIERQIETASDQLPEEKTQGFPWLAAAYDDLLAIQERMMTEILQMKTSPAPRAAEALREASRVRRQAEKKSKVLEYVLRYYETLFPWLPELRGEDIDDLLVAVTQEPPVEEDSAEDPARHWLTEAEYKNLSTTAKYQLALDRYWKKKKRPWEIGRDYERYVGYLYEEDGFSVYYQGIVEGLADLGRDLVATKDGRIEVVQCKYWSQDKQIHEKHINQLYGTVTAFRIDHPNDEVHGVFYTSTSLSQRAKQFAEKLGIEFVESSPLRPYPSIKCNVSRQDGTKIYHLPFDQQYDRTLVEQERLETCVTTVAEAEQLGFRRAFRWRGEPAQGGTSDQ